MSGGLYDIAEPGESLIKEACKGRAVGIDLGTTNSLVAVVRDASPVCLVDEHDDALLPSVVRYRAGATPQVGREAVASAAQFPHDTLASVKRFMGRSAADVLSREGEKKFAQYRIADESSAAGPVVRFRVAGDREVTPIEVSAEILKSLRQRAEAQLGGELEGAVITVPAYFDDAQRQATKDAARLAGLEVLRLVNEPTAAALAYGLDKKVNGTFAVYDLGGGTFDISILKLTDGVFEVKATGGDTALGGDDFDRALAELIVHKAPALAEKGGVELLQLARRMKHQLTEDDVVQHAGATVTRAEFDAAIATTLERTAQPSRRALRDAELKAADLDGVILVGGATRVPAVRAFVEKLFGRAPLADIDPDRVVALGAAVQADLLAGGSMTGAGDVLLLDVLPLSLGLQMMGGVVEKLIHRNSTIPCGATQTFTTYADGQTGFDLHVVQGERETADANRSLARFKLTGIPPMAAGMARLEVRFVVDADGLLKVSAKELTSGKESAVTVKPSYGLTDEEIERMLVESYEFAEQDLATRQRSEAKVEAERILAALAGALEVDGALLASDERAAIDAKCAALAQALTGDSHRLVRDRIAELDLATKPFAERRMNRDIGKAIGGHSVDEVGQSVSHAKGTEAHERRAAEHVNPKELPR